MPNGTATLPEEKVREEPRAPMGPRERAGSIASGIAATISAILAIIGLAGVYPLWLLSLSAIGIGISFLLNGAAIMTRLSTSLRDATEGRVQIAQVGAGTTGETLAGITGIALGLLGLLDIVPVVLMLCASVVFGAALVIGSRTKSFMHRVLGPYRQGPLTAQTAAGQVILATSALQVLLGLSVFTLAIIGLSDVAPLTLSLVCMLLTAAALVLTNPAVVGAAIPALRS